MSANGSHAPEPLRALRRRVAPTRAGWLAAYATLLLFGLTWQAGEELLLWPIGLLSLLMLSAAVARFAAADLRVEPPLPRVVFAGSDFCSSLALHASRLGLSPRDLLAWIEGGGARRGAACGFLPIVPRGTRGIMHVGLRIPERGRLRRLRVEVASSFPFGLFRAALEYELPVDWLVLPRLGSLRGLEQLRPAGAGRRPAPGRRAGEEEFFGLHEWRPGESLRRVHWKLSARRGRRLVSEHEGRDEPPLWLCLTRACAGGRRGDRRHPSFEKAVSLTATLAESFMRSGRSVHFGVLGAGEPRARARRGRAGLLQILAELAEARPEEGDAWALAASPGAPRDAECIVVLAGGRLRDGHGEPGCAARRRLIDVDAARTGELLVRRLRPAPAFLQVAAQ